MRIAPAPRSLRRARGSFVARSAAWLVALALVALPIIGAVHGWFGTTQRPLRSLEVEGELQRFSLEQLRAEVAEDARAGFFAVPLARIRQRLERLPGVAHVEVRKRWPDTLIVRVEERVPVAAFEDGRLVDAEGVVFGPFDDGSDAGMPRFEGDATHAPEMLRLFRDCEARLAAIALKPERIALSGRGSVRLGLASGVVLELGRDDSLQRLERFVTVWPKLTPPEGNQLARADLRYANGFAVQWEAVPVPPPAPPADAPAEAPIDAPPSATEATPAQPETHA